MGELEEKLTSVLNDPSMMAQIMSMAQSLGLGAPPAQQPQPAPMPEPDPVEKMELPDIATIQKIAGFASSSNIDRDQRTLLKALHPYLSQGRIHKLEKAMRAAKLAKFASGALSQLNLTGR